MALYINNWLGRKYSLVVTGSISIVGIIVEMTSATGDGMGSASIGQFIGGKIINSVSMGLAANIIPIYLSEVRRMLPQACVKH